MTGYSKKSSNGIYKRIQNYQISHVFGRTKNIFAFTAPWNIVYIPKIFDPFTGHESQGELSESFQRRFKEKVYDLFKDMIEDYNEEMNGKRFKKSLECCCTIVQKEMSKIGGQTEENINSFLKSVTEEFKPIIPDEY